MTDSNSSNTQNPGTEPDAGTDPAPPVSHIDDVDERMSVEQAGDLARSVIENVENVIVGQRSEIEHVLTTILARGHILLEDVPGVGKTMLARSIALSVDCSFKRIQFTPDLRPTDVTGVNVFNQKTREFEFNQGPIFANMVLADEINRAPPKAQSALLEAMEELQVSVDGDTYRVPRPFTVIATQNSVEDTGTYDLPVAEVDRFMKKIHLGYPSPDDESEMLSRVVGRHPVEDLEPVATTEEISMARATAAWINVEDEIRDYITRVVGYTRSEAKLGASPRGAIALLRSSQARALLDGRDYVIPDDVKAEAIETLGHRVIPDPTSESGREVVEEALEMVSVE